MIVYGDLRREEETGRLVAGLRARCAALSTLAAGIERRGAAARLLVEAGELAQGLLDAACEVRGRDDWGELEARCAGLTWAAARLPGEGDGGEVLRALEALARLSLPRAVTVRVPEGYAFYALYPELYALAARALGCPGVPTLVLGLRSIGTGLAGVVAVAAESGVPPVTLRPVGHPFRRVVRVGRCLEEVVFGQPAGARFLVVDEGPGLSGSSFGAVADWLEDGGVAPGRIHFFPGHGGDVGPQASPRHRERWQRAARHVVPFETLLLGQGGLPGATWFEDGVSNAGLQLEDVSGGRWRALHYAREEDWPPAHPAQERRKYLYRAHGRAWLARFAGLGRYGAERLALGRRLERAGLIPPVCDLRHGFLVGEWLSAARPLRAGGLPEPGRRVEVLARYLGFRARECPAPDGVTGADPGQLLEMARHNVGEWFGPGVAARLERWRAHLGAVGGRLRRVLTDNRMHLWEWLEMPGGRVLKADALDHHQAHDCVGAQDLAWDVAGAVVEWGLGGAEQEELDRRLADGTAYRPDPVVKGFYLVCYLAFQMGYYALAASAAGEAGEGARLRAAAGRYAGRLLGELGGPQ